MQRHEDDLLAKAYQDDGFVSLEDVVVHAELFIVGDPGAATSTRKAVAALCEAVRAVGENEDTIDLRNAEINLNTILV